MLEKGADVEAKNNSGKTALHLAIKNEDLEIEAVIEVLLEEGADPKAKNNDGKTAEDLAADRDLWDVLRLLTASENAQKDRSLPEPKTTGFLVKTKGLLTAFHR